MKNPDRKTVSRLEDLPNVGKVVAGDLRSIGIDHPQKLVGKDPLKLYEAICTATGTKHDPCMMDVMMSVVDFMNGGKPQPWWAFTEKRKKILR